MKGLLMTGVICKRIIQVVASLSGLMIEYCGSKRNLTGVIPQLTVLVMPMPMPMPMPIGKVSLSPLSAFQSHMYRNPKRFS